MPIDKPELKSCPFCGHDPYIQAHNEEGTHPKFFVACGNCYCNVGEAYDSYGEPAHCFDSREDALSAWNTRAQSTPPEQRAFIERGTCSHSSVIHARSVDCRDWIPEIARPEAVRMPERPKPIHTIKVGAFMQEPHDEPAYIAAFIDPYIDQLISELQTERAAHERTRAELEQTNRDKDFAGRILGLICVYGTLVHGEHPVDPPPHAAVDAILTQINRAEKAEAELESLRAERK